MSGPLAHLHEVRKRAIRAFHLFRFRYGIALIPNSPRQPELKLALMVARQ